MRFTLNPCATQTSCSALDLRISLVESLEPLLYRSTATNVDERITE